MKCMVGVELRDLDDRPIVAEGVQVPDVLTLLLNIREKVTDEVRAAIDKGLEDLNAKPLTVRSCAISALLGAYQDEKALGDEERLRRMNLARKFHKAKDGEIELKAKDVELINKLVPKRYGGVMVPVLMAEAMEGQDPVEKAEKTDRPDD